MAEELVRLTNQTDEMDEMVKEIPTLKVHLKVSAIKANTGLLNAVFAECVSDVCVWLCIAGSAAEAQHHPADVRRKSRRGRGAETGPDRREEHVQMPDRRTSEEPEINFYRTCVDSGTLSTNQSTNIATHAVPKTDNLSLITVSKESSFIFISYFILKEHI